MDIIGSGAKGMIKMSQAVTILGNMRTKADSMILLCITDRDELI